MGIETSKKGFLFGNPKKLVCIVIGYAIMLIISNLPGFMSVTPLGMTILGIYAGTIFLWCTTSIAWPSLVTLVLVGMSSYEASVTEVFSTAFSSSAIHLMVVMMCFAYIIRETGLVTHLYAKLMNKPFVQGHPWRLTAILLGIALIGAALTDTVPSMFICWAFIDQIAQQVGYKKGDKWVVAMVVGIAIISVYGNSILPYQGVVVSSFGMLAAAQEGATYQYGQYFAFSVIFSVLLSIVLFLVIKFIYRPDITPLKSARIETKKEDAKLLGSQKIALALLAVLVVTLMASSYLPAGNAVKMFVQNLGTLGVAIIIIAVACILHYDSKPIVTIRACFNSVAWEAVMMVTCAIFMSGAVLNDATGIKSMLEEVLSSLFSGTSAYVLVAVLLILSLVLTNIINNIVVISIFVPIIATLAAATNINTIAATALLIYTSNTAFVLPSASQFAALVHSHELVSIKEVYKFAAMFIVIAAIVVVVVALPVANMIFH